MTDEGGIPRVSIAIPTFNRRPLLERALDSALGQTYPELEVIVSDNASTDGTEELVRERAARDPRLRYVRRAANEGPIVNFNEVLQATTGAFVVPLADDDWLDLDYVERCVAELQADPGLALVTGSAWYYDGDRRMGAGVDHQHADAEADDRLLAFWRTVDDNGCFYGIMRGELVRDELLPLTTSIADDWFYVSRAAWTGRVRTLTDIHVHRSRGGSSATRDTIAATVGVPWLQVQLSPFFIGWFAAADVFWRSSVYAHLAPRHRAALGLRVGRVVLRRFLTLRAVRRRLRG